MRVRTFTGVEEFHAVAEEWLLRHEVDHNLVYGMVCAARAMPELPPGMTFALVESDDGIEGCGLLVPGDRLALTAMPSAAAARLAEDLAGAGMVVPAVFGPESAAEAFAGVWGTATGAKGKATMRMHFHSLTELVEPERPAPGRLEVAGEAHREILTAWTGEFMRETHHSIGSPSELVSRWLPAGDVFVWVDSVPVTMAVASGRTPHGARIGFVYTPPEARRYGYASTCVARISRLLLDAGMDHCVLYTDPDNPTSNRIYRRLGYEYRGTSADFTFTPMNEDVA
ncbi:MAG: GNAT family N-acetyltransferase [Gemmatimonadota bacterium]|nr:GNAT family N-acetyltransferase [Gemmatimonadota bacterium]